MMPDDGAMVPVMVPVIYSVGVVTTMVTTIEAPRRNFHQLLSTPTHISY